MNLSRTLTLGVCLTAGLLLGRTAPDIQITPPTGKPISVSQHKGNVVLLQFLLTDCSHCQATARMLSELQAEFANRGFQVIGVAFNPNAVIQSFREGNGVTFPVGEADRTRVAEYLGYSPTERFVVPQIMLIGRDGQIRAQSLPMGSPELQDKAHLRELILPLLAEKRR
jgi:peroxiredoxin